MRKKSKSKLICLAIFVVLMCCGAGGAVAFIFLAKEHASAAVSEYVCMWNATNLSYVNGLYSSAGQSRSGDPLYALPIDESCDIDDDNRTQHDTLYLFNSMQSIWSISWLRDNSTDFALQGICASNTITNVTECNSLWQIPQGRPQRDVMLFNDQCPSVACKGLQVSYDVFITDELCIGVFANKVADNLYQKGDSDLFLFFNPTLFRWACGSRSDMIGCVELDSLTSYAAQQSWYNAHRLTLDGETISMPWSNSHQATIECLQTAQPTQSPTASPSRSPSKSPTRSPTTSPTKSPTPDQADRVTLRVLYGCLLLCLSCLF